jgi:hypothetical protein
MAPNTDTNQNRRIDDRLPDEPLDWEDPDVKHARESTRLANAMADAGAAFLAHMDVGGVIAQIPNTDQYVVAGTLAMIAKVLPADAPIPPLTAPAPLTDYVLMPKRLTAENGAKGALSGEFKESVQVTCPVCDGSGDDPDFDGDPTEHGGACLECNGEGTVAQNVPVSWDTIKDIYKAAVDLLAKAAPAAPVQTAPYAYEEDNGADTELIYAAWFANGMGKMDPDCIYRPLYLAAPVQAVTERAEPLHEEGDFYAVARARGFSDFGLTFSGNYSDPMLQALREKYDAGRTPSTGEASKGESA